MDRDLSSSAHDPSSSDSKSGSESSDGGDGGGPEGDAGICGFKILDFKNLRDGDDVTKQESGRESDPIVVMKVEPEPTDEFPPQEKSKMVLNMIPCTKNAHTLNERYLLQDQESHGAKSKDYKHDYSHDQTSMSKMAPTTAAERQRQYRARLKADPARREQYLQRERQRWKNNVEAGKKQAINDLSPREQRHKRKSWRAAYNRSKERREALKNLTTPPLSPEDAPHPQSPEDPQEQDTPSRQHVAGKKKTRKERSRLMMELQELKEELDKERKRSTKYKKRYQRVKRHSESPRSKVNDLTVKCPVNPKIRKILLFHHSMIGDIKRKYQQATTERDRQLIAKLSRGGKTVKKYRLQRMAEESLGFSPKRWKHNFESLNYERKNTTRFADVFKQKVKKFYLRDDVSRITTGTKQTLTRNKIKKQKRFLVDTLKNLHRRFLSENHHNRISYSLFCIFRPFWVVNPTISERDTCMCKLHENLGFVAEKLHQLKLIEMANLENLVEKVCCNSSNKNCMYGECVDCKDKCVPISSTYDGTAKVSFTQWVTEGKEMDKKKEGEKRSTVKVTIKKSVEGTQENLTELFHTYFQRFKRHYFNIKQQYGFCRELKKNMFE
uniref:uncharacterized protein n=1 Tax=Myxine glutinosa TaxID=7769 RepID=UPI00358E783C